MPSDAALEFVKDVVRHIHFYAEVDYDENVEHTVDGFFVRVYKDVEGTKDDEVCYSTQIEFDHVDNIVHIVQRKSLDDNLDEIEEVEEHVPHLYFLNQKVIKNVTREQVKALARFFEKPRFRETILGGMQEVDEPQTEESEEEDDALSADSGDESDPDDDGVRIIQRVVEELSAPPETADITYEDDMIYVVDKRTLEGDITVYFTTNIWYEKSKIYMKTWRAFDVVYANATNQHDYNVFVYSSEIIEASTDHWACVVQYLTDKTYRAHMKHAVEPHEKKTG